MGQIKNIKLHIVTDIKVTDSKQAASYKYYTLSWQVSSQLVSELLEWLMELVLPCMRLRESTGAKYKRWYPKSQSSPSMRIIREDLKQRCRNVKPLLCLGWVREQQHRRFVMHTGGL